MICLMKGLGRCLFLPLLAVLLSGASTPLKGAETRTPEKSKFPCSEAEIAHYTAYRTRDKIKVDGHLDEAAWKAVPRSPRFIDILSGKPTVHDTHAAVLWDDENLYIGFWVQEPHVNGTLTEHNSPIYSNNDVEVFIAGRDSYYEFEINSLGTVYEVFFVWQEAYEKGGFAEAPEFQKTKMAGFNGVGFTTHPRGGRLGSWHFRFPGMQTAVHVDGTVNDDKDRDRGWTVELAFPWKGMPWLAKADHRSLPPKHDDVWRIDFSRFNQYKSAPPDQDSGGWVWSRHGIWDSHIPECFPYIHFSTQDVTTVKKPQLTN